MKYIQTQNHFSLGTQTLKQNNVKAPNLKKVIYSTRKFPNTIDSAEAIAERN